MAATEVGINMRDYGQLVVEAKAVVNDVGPNPSANKGASMQKELETTMQAYTDALTIWNTYIKFDVIFLDVDLPNQLPGQMKNLHNTYRFPIQNNPVRYIKRDIALTTIWEAAKVHLSRATELAK